MTSRDFFVCPLEEEHPFLTVFDGGNQFWFEFTMMVYLPKTFATLIRSGEALVLWTESIPSKCPHAVLDANITKVLRIFTTIFTYQECHSLQPQDYAVFGFRPCQSTSVFSAYAVYYRVNLHHFLSKLKRLKEFYSLLTPQKPSNPRPLALNYFSGIKKM